MGHWNAGVGRSRDRRADARDDFKANAGGLERGRFFTAPAEHEGIAALQPNDAATAKRLASEGASVVVVDLNEEGARRVATEIREAGGRAETLIANVGSPPEIEKMIAFAVEKYGRLDILHNNAIRLYTGRVGEMSLEHWRKSVDIGLTAYWYATRCALAVMVPQRPRGMIGWCI